MRAPTVRAVSLSSSLIWLGRRANQQDPARPRIAPKAPLIYSFDRVFSPSTSQSTFFTTTTLPLVEKLLHGENGLMFAYGVSNSGKSYTISGGDSADIRGVLPRGIDVVFNSIKGMECKTNVSRRPPPVAIELMPSCAALDWRTLRSAASMLSRACSIISRLRPKAARANVSYCGIHP